MDRLVQRMVTAGEAYQSRRRQFAHFRDSVHRHADQIARKIASMSILDGAEDEIRVAFLGRTYVIRHRFKVLSDGETKLDEFVSFVVDLVDPTRLSEYRALSVSPTGQVTSADGDTVDFHSRPTVALLCLLDPKARS